ncbi:F0F1 ATP synthase subunit A [Flavobacterium sp. I3-2]|uniref:F0F1 ATP synthase subunit A n=1 Tax=Flavobacterium sp. I3-2 TaxID=2748319 RepID=UPI0015B1972E|nr:F0F1 ATP synthase subunit A [Flavobacterium sp. I3-2]
MVTIKKSLHLLAAVLFALSPVASMANNDTIQQENAVNVEQTAIAVEATDHAASHGEEHAEKSNDQFVKEYIGHHLMDDHYYSFFGDKELHKHYGFALPIILIDNGLKVFMSTEDFVYNSKVIERDGQYYAYFHGKIVNCDAEGNIKGYEYRKDDKGEYITIKNKDGKDIKQKFEVTYNIKSHEIHTASDFHVSTMPLDFSITKNVAGLMLASLLLFLGFTALAKTYKNGPNALPKGIARGLEPLVIYVRDEMAKPNIGHKYKQFMPYLLSVFFLIFLLNLLGLTPLGLNVTGNISVTVCLALFTFLYVNISANKDYWKHIFWMPGVPVPMKIVLAPIEVLGMFTKPFSLLIRLFANITAGHSVVMGLIAVAYIMQEALSTPGAIGISFFLTLFLTFLEILVAFLQAFIFTMLSSLFIGSAVQEHDHH